MKKIIYYILSLFIIVIINQTSFAQIASGEWRTHLPLNNGRKIVLAQDKVYMLSKDGLIKYSKKSGEIEIMSKTTGLNDVKASQIAYNKKHNSLVIGYDNGNIDIIKDNRITNIDDIKRKSINGDKKIYSLLPKDDLIYIGCGFGVVVLDISQKEIKETWFIGENGTNVKINSIDTYDKYILLATDAGVYRGNTSLHLPDFSNWEIITKENVPEDFSWIKTGTFNFVKYFNDKIIANYYINNTWGGDSILVYDNGNWSFLDKDYGEINAICGNDQQLIICTYYGIKSYNKDLEKEKGMWGYITESDILSARPYWAEIESDNKIWIADSRFGLIECEDFWKCTNIRVNGPLSSDCFSMSSYKNSLFVAPGGYEKTTENFWKDFQFFKYQDNQWTNYLGSDFPETEGYRDLVKIIVDPNDQTRYICATWNAGIIEFRNKAFYKVYNNTNSTLNPVFGTVDYFRVSDVCFDKDANLWATSILSSPAINVLTKSNKWIGFNLSGYINPNTTLLDKIIITQDNIKWITTARSDKIIVLDDNGTPEEKNDDKIRVISLSDDKGKVISSNIYAIKEDLKGNIWVGCDKGVAVFYNVKDVFKKENFFAKQIKIPRKDSTNYSDILLSTEKVTAIEIDGANKKWFGTEFGGVYYISEDGLEEIHHFTTENSPILSNYIQSIAVMPDSGEVFFGTSSGIISYGGTATQGKDQYDNVYAYPNPVKPDFYGPITIIGLLEKSTVKITDVSGNLIYETISDGGSATWDGKNIYGEKVKTGIYLVLASDEKGIKRVATKILFINSKE